jgi:alpha-pyrone synthase
MSFISPIATANPGKAIKQMQIASFMQKAMHLNEADTRKLRVIFKASGIEQRYSVLEDYGKTEGFQFYPENLSEKHPDTKTRNEIFQQHALPLAQEAAAKAILLAKIKPDEITHLIVVSCTGLYAPGLDIDLVNALHLSPFTERTAINFMGCYAAFNGLKTADAIVKANPSSKVLLVCCELCSIHFQQEASDDNLLANALFADGCAATVVTAQTGEYSSLQIENYASAISPKGAQDMAWTIGNFGFEMKLSTYVPAIVEEGIANLCNRLLERYQLSASQIKHFAIHPGGIKILQAIEKALGLSKESNRFAYEVLQQFGNMSSPTVLYVLKNLLQNLQRDNNDEKIVSFAFGPGLTLESMLFTYRHG